MRSVVYGVAGVTCIHISNGEINTKNWTIYLLWVRVSQPSASLQLTASAHSMKCADGNVCSLLGYRTCVPFLDPRRRSILVGAIECEVSIISVINCWCIEVIRCLFVHRLQGSRLVLVGQLPRGDDVDCGTAARLQDAATRWIQARHETRSRRP